ncbi:hypothetical protein LCGC14_0506350 [marine sediment metagenome]|uniref:Uncharacterized protein n=1 Tax=marine sediment metagenome TaxID=412755 RepID=A0A0F9S2F9_9ZZZZ
MVTVSENNRRKNIEKKKKSLNLTRLEKFFLILLFVSPKFKFEPFFLNFLG